MESGPGKSQHAVRLHLNIFCFQFVKKDVLLEAFTEVLVALGMPQNRGISQKIASKLDPDNTKGCIKEILSDLIVKIKTDAINTLLRENLSKCLFQHVQ